MYFRTRLAVLALLVLPVSFSRAAAFPILDARTQLASAVDAAALGVYSTLCPYLPVVGCAASPMTPARPILETSVYSDIANVGAQPSPISYPAERPASSPVIPALAPTPLPEPRIVYRDRIVEKPGTQTEAVERVVAVSSGASKIYVDDAVTSLRTEFDALVADVRAQRAASAPSVVYVPTPGVSNPTQGVPDLSALSQRIDQLSGTKITDATISNATITGSTITAPRVSAEALDVSGTTTLGTTTVNGTLTVNGNTNITSGGELTVGDKIIAPGEIGLGTSTPTAKLHVQSTVTSQIASLIHSLAGQTAALFDVQDENDVSLFSIAANGLASFARGITAAGTITFSSLTDGVVKSTGGVLSGGNTLAGSDVTADSLDFTELKDTLALDASTDIAADGAETLSITNTGSGNSFQVNDQAGDTSPFVVDGSGNVAIGTTTPGATLDIAAGAYGNFQFTAAGELKLPHTNASGFSAIIAPATRGIRLYSGATGTVYFPGDQTNAAATIGYRTVTIGEASAPAYSVYLNSIGASDLALRAGDANATRTASIILLTKDNQERMRINVASRFVRDRLTIFGYSRPSTCCVI